MHTYGLHSKLKSYFMLALKAVCLDDITRVGKESGHPWLENRL